MKNFLLFIGFIVAANASCLTQHAAMAQPAKAAEKPAQPAAAPAPFVVLPGDVLQISVWREEGMDKEVRVLPDGSITFPLVGTLDVRNMTPREIQDQITSELSNIIPDASVSVIVTSPLGHKASVLGQVQKPGEIIIASPTTVMQALSQAGGLTPFADDSDIVLIRTAADGTKKSVSYPYNAIVRGKKLDQDIELQPGDVIVVPTDGLF